MLMKKFANRKQRRDLLAIPAVIFVLRSAGVLSLVVMSVLVRNSVTVAICNHQLPILMPGGGGGYPHIV